MPNRNQIKSKIFFIVVLFFILANNVLAQTDTDKNITGTYKGLNDNFEFVFVGESGQIHVFQEISDFVTIDLFDEATIGKKFMVTWTELSVNITDDEGEPTGEKAHIKRIKSVKVL